MAKGPDKPNIPQDAEVAEQISGRKKEAVTPAKVEEALNAREIETLNYFRERDKSFWKRVGKYEGMIKDKALKGGETIDDAGDPMIALPELREITDRMADLGKSTTSRLGVFSRKHAKRFAKITAQLNVSNRTLGAVRKQRALIAQDQKDLDAGDAGLRQQILTDHPVMGRTPGLKYLLVPRDEQLAKSEALDYKKLETAARNVKTKMEGKKRAWETAAKQKFEGVRRAEESLRNVLLRHNPASSEVIEEQIRAAAAGDTDPIAETIDALKPNGFAPQQTDELKSRLMKWVDLISGKSGGASKAFEAAGRQELTGPLADVLKQIQALSIGTRLVANIPDHKGNPQDLVLDSKRNGHLIFRFVRLDPNREKKAEYQLAVDPTGKSAWVTDRRLKTQEGKNAVDVAKKVKAAAKSEGLSDKDSEKIYKTAKIAMLAAGADSDSVKKAVKSAVNALPAASIPTGATKKRIWETAKTEADSEYKDADGKKRKRLAPPARKEDADEYLGSKWVEFNGLKFDHPNSPYLTV